MSERNRFIARMILALLPTVIVCIAVIPLFQRWDELLSMDDYGASLFPEVCSIVALSLFLLMGGTGLSVRLVDSIKANVFASRDMGYERDTNHYSLYVGIAGIFVLLSVLYSQAVDPYLLGESRYSVAFQAMLPLCIGYLTMRVITHLIDRMVEDQDQTTESGVDNE